MTDLLIHNAEVDGRHVDVRIIEGHITTIAPALHPEPGEEVLDAEGGALIPGLTDHHLHLFALASADRSTRCGPPAVYDRRALTAALAMAPTDDHGWVRVGYHESVAGLLDAAGLDALHARRPVRIQHRSGALWMVNVLPAHLLDLTGADHPGIERDTDGHPTGRIWRADHWLRTRLPPRRTARPHRRRHPPRPLRHHRRHRRHPRPPTRHPRRPQLRGPHRSPAAARHAAGDSAG